MDKSFSFEKGFAVVDADEPVYLETLRKEIFSITKDVFKLPNSEPEDGFNNFHTNIKDMTLGELNKFRIELIQRITAECNVRELVFKAFEKRLLQMLGPDILAQKNCNLVLQPPGDQNPSELHRDAPANSPYELVVWVPLVNCFDTKAMYIVDIKKTERHSSSWTPIRRIGPALRVMPNHLP